MAEIEGKWLGKKVAHPKRYAPEVLVAVPRKLNREQYQIEAHALPFVGFDVWHAYEVSFLTDKGLPVTGLLKMVYRCNSAMLVESKSLKLYLNSFNMECMGANMEVAKQNFLHKVETDISACVQSKVEISLYHETIATPFDFVDYQVLEKVAHCENLDFEDVKENPSVLATAENEENELKVASHLLRSNCKITFQPDWGTVFIHIQGSRVPSKTALLKYIVSFRDENHFHEEVCEMIYKRLWDTFVPNQLMVTCIYTRRGGIDICPSRASHPHLLPAYLADVHTLSQKLLRQ